jgi:aldehyde:ferredoxin oxidoreductase
MQGETGSLLTVHLDTGSIRREPVPDDLRRAYLGGRGVGVYLVSRLADPMIDPYDRANVLVLSNGLCTGSGIPMGARYDLVTKSPLTGTLSSANSGGHFGTELKRTGVDVILFRGAASTPVYLYITGDDAELRDATPYWGMTTSICTRSLQRDLKEDHTRIACIGPAGEHLCRFASVMNDLSRAAGRGGIGAVMGAKSLKAIVVKGDHHRRVTSPALKEAQKLVQTILEQKEMTRGSLNRYGTASSMNLVNESHLLPTRNFQESYFPGADRISGEEIVRTILRGKKACYACPIACGRVTEVDGIRGEGPEYETLWAFGPACGIADLRIITRANYLCNDLGLDTISTGSTIACAMEMSERGYLSSPLCFSDTSVILPLIELIAYRKGIGDELAEGSYRFAKRYGHPELSMSVKGMEIPAYDPRGLKGQGLEYATSVRGACHVYGNMVYPELLGIPVKLDPLVTDRKALWVKWLQDLAAVIDSLGICLFTLRAFSVADYATLASVVSGFPLGEHTLLEIGERVWNLQNLFNRTAGYTQADDTLPARLMDSEGGWMREPLLSEYYALRGWDRQGNPTSETMKRLGISWREEVC